MTTLVTAQWVEEHLQDPNLRLLDPRRPMRYLQGHLKNAVNLPIYKAFDAEGMLLPDEQLQRWLGAAGLDNQTRPLIYDSYDGQNGAMLAWLLEYLGCTDVRMLKIFYERWVAEGHEVFYKPVAPISKTFSAPVKPQLRVEIDELRRESALKLIDFRSREEYTGQLDRDGKPGHIPGAVNIVWRDLVGRQQEVLASPETIQQLVNAAGIQPGDRIVAYCRLGMRAALGYLALQQAGYDIRLYDRSYAEWARRGLPVEA
ncbi:MAG TPA: rhodanese-like domain-containing protein [Candidatus Tectomicrobia bacterium]|nr:rhodanese-like domain-containing protein [Candidatus Tectomicrobia bacterium]